MFHHSKLSNEEFRSFIRKREIKLGGNKQLRIYGTLSCRSGKRMKKENRVFFTSGEEAIREGYRPCGHCMKKEFRTWQENKLAISKG